MTSITDPDHLRLSPGEVATNVQRRRACYDFLQAATELEPRILGELRDEIWFRGNWIGEPGDNAIHRWLKRWRIEMPCSYEWAFNVIIFWLSYPPSPDGPVSFFWPHFGSMVEGQSLTRLREWLGPHAKEKWSDEWGRDADRLNLPPVLYDPLTEARAHALDRIMKELRAAVRSELDRIIQAALADGNVPTITKTTGVEHFHWLARYQVKGERISQIAGETKERKTVRDAIKELAELIGLNMREPDRPGRPRANSN